jgi:DNA-binding phage protein
VHYELNLRTPGFLFVKFFVLEVIYFHEIFKLFVYFIKLLLLTLVEGGYHGPAGVNGLYRRIAVLKNFRNVLFVLVREVELVYRYYSFLHQEEIHLESNVLLQFFDTLYRKFVFKSEVCDFCKLAELEVGLARLGEKAVILFYVFVVAYDLHRLFTLYHQSLVESCVDQVQQHVGIKFAMQKLLYFHDFAQGYRLFSKLFCYSFGLPQVGNLFLKFDQLIRLIEYRVEDDNYPVVEHATQVVERVGGHARVESGVRPREVYLYRAFKGESHVLVEQVCSVVQVLVVLKILREFVEVVDFVPADELELFLEVAKVVHEGCDFGVAGLELDRREV